jgi:hypothetical protein
MSGIIIAKAGDVIEIKENKNEEKKVIMHESSKCIINGIKNYKEKNCDIVLKCGEKEFQCHNSLLSAISPIFERIFNSEMRKDNKVFVLDFNNSVVIEHIINYVYTGSISTDVLTMVDICSACHFYDISILYAELLALVQKNVTLNNVLSIYHRSSSPLDKIFLKSLIFHVNNNPDILTKQLLFDELIQVLDNDFKNNILHTTIIKILYYWNTTNKLINIEQKEKIIFYVKQKEKIIFYVKQLNLQSINLLILAEYGMPLIQELWPELIYNIRERLMNCKYIGDYLTSSSEFVTKTSFYNTEPKKRKIGLVEFIDQNEK